MTLRNFFFFGRGFFFFGEAIFFPRENFSARTKKSWKSSFFCPRTKKRRFSDDFDPHRKNPLGVPGKGIILTSQTVKKSGFLPGCIPNEEPDFVHPLFRQKRGCRRAKKWHDFHFLGGRNRVFLVDFQKFLVADQIFVFSGHYPTWGPGVPPTFNSRPWKS